MKSPCSPVRAFSLVELLAVVSVISLLTSLTLPALMSSHRASSVTNAGNRLADMASMARQTAMSRNAITALVVSSKPQGGAQAKQAAIVLQYDGAANAWIPLGGWSRLPESVAARDNAPDTTALTRLATPSLRVDGAEVSDYTAFVFYPDGHMDSSGSTRELLVQSAVESSGSNFYKLVFNADTSAFLVVRP